MQVYTVCFFGHRVIHDPIPIAKQLEDWVHHILQTHQYVEFLVGRDGDFDILAASIIHKCKQHYRNDNSALVLVLPYMKTEYRENNDDYLKYYDEIEVFSATHYKAAFKERNRSMIDRSHFAIFYVRNDTGGAHAAMRYASKTNTPYVNLGEPRH